MAKPIFRYVIHRVGIKKPLQRGEIRKKKLEQAVKALQRRIKKTVTKQHVQLVMKVWNADDTTETFSKQYDDKRDFKTFRRVPKWRKVLSKKVKYSRKPIQLLHWFIAIGKKGQVDLTRLAYEPKKGTLLKRKRKRLFGPFEDEAAATAFRDKILARRDARAKQTSFTQRRRYKGPMEEES